MHKASKGTSLPQGQMWYSLQFFHPPPSSKSTSWPKLNIHDTIFPTTPIKINIMPHILHHPLQHLGQDSTFMIWANSVIAMLYKCRMRLRSHIFVSGWNSSIVNNYHINTLSYYHCETVAVYRYRFYILYERQRQCHWQKEAHVSMQEEVLCVLFSK